MQEIFRAEGSQRLGETEKACIYLDLLSTAEKLREFVKEFRDRLLSEQELAEALLEFLDVQTEGASAYNKMLRGNFDISSEFLDWVLAVYSEQMDVLGQAFVLDRTQYLSEEHTNEVKLAINILYQELLLGYLYMADRYRALNS